MIDSWPILALSAPFIFFYPFLYNHETNSRLLGSFTNNSVYLQKINRKLTQ